MHIHETKSNKESARQKAKQWDLKTSKRAINLKKRKEKLAQDVLEAKERLEEQKKADCTGKTVDGWRRCPADCPKHGTIKENPLFKRAVPKHI